MLPLNPLAVAWQAWRASRRGQAALQGAQQRRLAALVHHARRHSPFYAAHYRDVPDPVQAVTQLPPVTKARLMAHFDDWVADRRLTRARVEAHLAAHAYADGPLLDDYLVWTTSGTTGAPGILLHDRGWQAVQAGLLLARGASALAAPAVLRSLWRERGRTAALFAADGPFLGVTLVAQLRRANWLLDRALRAFSVLEPLPALVAALNDFRPAILVGYATALALLAREQRAGRLAIRPALVYSSGETLNDAMRAAIQAAWGAPARDVYATSETGPTKLTVRLESRPAADRPTVWAALQTALAAWLARQAAPGVTLTLAPERPAPDPKSGKMRQVLVAPAHDWPALESAGTA